MNATLKTRIVDLLKAQQFAADGTELNGSLQNMHIARFLQAPLPSVRRATRELAQAGAIRHLGTVSEVGRVNIIEYQLPIGWGC